jgi:membrane protein
MERNAAHRESDEELSAKSGASGWLDIAKRTWRESNEDNLGLIASGIAFNSFLALIPLLTAVVLTYGLVASSYQVAEHITALAQALPEEAAAIISGQLENMVSTAGRGAGLGLLLSMAVALFGALRGATGIIIALNIVYDVDESRSTARQIGVALAIIIGLVLLFMLASVAISALNMLSDLLPDLGGALHSVLQIVFWVSAAAAACLVIALIYAHAPNREKVGWRRLLPGSLIATSIWVAATFSFSFYVSNFGNYNATYGAMGAVIIFLTWLYLSAYIVLLGAELNQVLECR